MADFRGHPEIPFEGEHVCLSELKEDPNVYNCYLKKNNIPNYPESVLFRISNVSHVTGQTGLYGIIRDNGFRKPDHLATNDNFLWCSLSVTEKDIASADRCFLRWSYGAVAPNQPPFLEKFTTSPAFQSESRYGNFRFTFPFRKLLYEYSSQFCKDSSPVLRVLHTDLYKKEILYSVLVHPRHIPIYNQYPRLPYSTAGVCSYREGQMFWLCQSPSDRYCHRLVEDCTGQIYARQLKGGEYYVWDHVAVAFHMEPGWILSVDREELLNSVSACDISEPCLLREPDNPLSIDEAEKILEDLRERNGQQIYF